MNLTEFQSNFFCVAPSEDVVVLTVKVPQLTEEENLDELEQEFVALIEKYGARKIVLELSSVRYVTSSAIGKIISLHRRLVRQAGRLVICGLQPDVQEILNTSHLLEYFFVADSSDAAVSQFT